MKKDHLKYLACPACSGELAFGSIERQKDDLIKSGDLRCQECQNIYPIVKYIPRFVPADNYAKGFGFQWLKHSKTQYDSYTKTNTSEKRFFEETKWLRDLKGEVILEVGCGSGRFTEQAIKTGAMVVSMDYSVAVEANYQSHGGRDDVLIVQASIYEMPFRKNFFNKIFCLGVLQHTPDPEKSFLTLPNYLKDGGKLAVDIYLKSFFRSLFYTKYWVRPFVKNMNSEKLYNLCRKWVDFVWPRTALIAKLPKGRYINKCLFIIADYRGLLPFSDDLLKEWAILDTFDMWSPAYDYPQTMKTVKKWFNDSKLKNVEINYGYNGIEGRGEK